MIRTTHCSKSLIRTFQCFSRPTISTPSSSLLLQRSNHSRHNYHEGAASWQQISNVVCGVRQFSSSSPPPEKDDDRTSVGDNVNDDSAADSVGDSGNDNDFSYLIAQKYDQAAIPSGMSDAVSTPWEPCYYNAADLVIESIRWIHETAGLEYAWSIIAFVVLVRVGLFPLQVLALRNNSKIAQVGEIRKQKSASLNMNDPAHRAKLAQETKQLLAQHGVKSIYSVLPQLTAIPFAAAFLMGWNKMSTVFHDDLVTGGLLWFPDLTIPDPYYLLPVINALTYLGVTEWVRNQAYDPFSPATSSRTIFRRVLAFLFIPMGANLSSALVLSWETFYLTSLAHVLIFENSSVKKLFGIWEPPKPQTSNTSVSLKPAADGKEAQGLPKRAIRRGGRKR